MTLDFQFSKVIFFMYNGYERENIQLDIN